MEEEIKKKKFKWWQITLIVIACILIAMIVASSIIAIVTNVGYKGLLEAVSNVSPVEYTQKILLPEIDETTGKAKLDENGCFNFIDKEGLLDKRNFRVLQLTDVHFGAGAFSLRTDNWTMKTVEDLIRKVKPDLVVVTGDVGYPVPFQAGTMNNKHSAKLFANLMENLGIYWTLVFGNHDTEAYSYYNRTEIGAFYNSSEYKHCLFDDSVKKLNDGTEVFGVGNFAINIKNQKGELIHSIFMIDSNAYLPNDPVGLLWHYDRIHDNQVKWYEEMSDKLGISDSSVAKSTLYFHIPTKDVGDKIDEWNASGDSETFKLIDGTMGEYIAYGTKEPNNLYDAMVSHNGTGIFYGHDHKNNASYCYDKDGFGKGNLGVKFTYGMSIDYLAYPGIYKETLQRGGRIIEINASDKLNYEPNDLSSLYEAKSLEEDKPFGFFTYRVPYWKNLYKEFK